MGQSPAEILTQTGAGPSGERGGCLEQTVEGFGVGGEPECLEPGRPAGGVRSEQDEVAGVGYEDEAVALPVAADLVAGGGQPGVVAGGLDFDYAALGCLAFAGPAALDLLGGVEAEVGMAGALVGELSDAEYLGF